MIGATRLSGSYSSFWREVTPTVDLFVRKINSLLYERVEAPCDFRIDPVRSALVAETAFAAFDLYSRNAGDRGRAFERLCVQAVGDARRRLEHLSDQEIQGDLNPDELAATRELFHRLCSYFLKRGRGELIVRPGFPGCGYVDWSEGDVIFDGALFEVKVVDRSFRSVDVRQLITYAALNHKSRKYQIRDIGVYNPRRGTEFRMNLEEVCMEISGSNTIDLLELIAYAVASGDVSR